MKGRVLLLDRVRGHEAAALMVDGMLQELAIDTGNDLQPGAICRVVVDRVMAGQGGCFARLPGGANGYLRGALRQTPGQSLLAQISSCATEAGKAMTLSQRLQFRARCVILTPGAPGLNISRRIADRTRRARLTEIATQGMEGADENLGVIIRSAASVADDAAILQELACERTLAEKVLALADGPPALLLPAPSAHELALMDWLDVPPDELDDAEGSFATHQVNEAVEAFRAAQVPLAMGGDLWVEPTRALVAVDVNTGADNSPAAGLRTNLAAAQELPRQLRIRGLGGQVLVDFAPCPKRDRSQIDRAMKSAFQADRGVSLVGWTALGLYELTRKRDRLPLSELWP